MPLSQLIGAVKELALARDAQQIQRSVARSVRNLVDADGATVVFCEGNLCYYAEEDAIEPLWKGQRFPMAACISGWVMQHNIPAVIPDIYADERIPAGLYKPTFVKSLAMLPVRTTATVAAIGSYWRDHHTPSEEDLLLLEALADAAARAIENVNLIGDLERQVQTRTAALQQKQEELEHFIHCVSHDLRSPLITVKTFLDVLHADIGDDNRQQVEVDIDHLHSAAERMDQLLAALTQFSRVGRLDNPPRLLSFDGLVQEALSVLAGSIQLKSIELSVAAAPLSLYGDPLRLGQLWQNLVENAIKYMGSQPTPRIEIGVDLQPEPPVFFVRDNGIGIEPQHTERIFGLFTRLAAGGEGIGLGLALVKKIVDLYGGRIWAESAGPGTGSCFKFTLPGAMEAPSRAEHLPS